MIRYRDGGLWPVNAALQIVPDATGTAMVRFSSVDEVTVINRRGMRFSHRCGHTRYMQNRYLKPDFGPTSFAVSDWVRHYFIILFLSLCGTGHRLLAV
jgi:hypothetical protein